jgi:hypothetical protein
VELPSQIPRTNSSFGQQRQAPDLGVDVPKWLGNSPIYLSDSNYWALCAARDCRCIRGDDAALQRLA